MTEPNQVFCEQCGTKITDSSRFCTECGAELSPSPSEGPPQSAPEPVAAGATGGTGGTGGATFSSSSAATMNAPSWSSDFESLPMIAGLPLELWLVIGAFAVPGVWIAFNVIKALPDAFKFMGSSYLGFRIGLAFLLILLLVGVIGAAMLAIAWRLYQRDRVGRGLAYAFGGTIIVSVVFSDAATTAEVCAMVFSAIGIAILGLTPRVRAIFDQAHSADGVPTSVIVSRTAIAVFSFVAVVVALIYLLLASEDGKYVAAAIIAAGAAGLAMVWSRRLVHADRQARLYLSIGGVAVAVLLLIIGQSATGLLFPLGLIASAVGTLWIPNDARAFFGDQPLHVGQH